MFGRKFETGGEGCEEFNLIHNKSYWAGKKPILSNEFRKFTTPKKTNIGCRRSFFYTKGVVLFIISRPLFS